ncbi:MAG: GspE/PulE family protein [Desulfobacterales bacterium]|jgi:type II secretory ATPase GspE/PulE/Tfp pilus assembly ATPase PilB-like protein
MSNPNPKSGYTQNQIQHLKSEVAYRARLQRICNKINAAANLDEILIDLKDDITTLFATERITVYVVDGTRRELVSRFKSGDDIAEIRLPISTSSIAGWCACKKNPLNIKNVYNAEELAAIDQDLKFDKSWDEKTGFKTRQVLAYPIIFNNYILGVIQLINRRTGKAFIKIDELALKEVAHILGIALFNQKKIARSKRPRKFEFLIENNFLTQQELDQAIAHARKTNQVLENVLMSEYEIPKKYIMAALGKFFRVETTEFNQNTPIPGQLMTGLKIPFLRNNVWVPLGEEDGKIIIAIDNPQDLQRIGEIKALFPGKGIIFRVALKQDILEFIRLFSEDEQQLSDIGVILDQLQQEAEEIEEAESTVGEEDSAVVKLVNKIILDANERGASDIHIEPLPGKDNTQVRIRIDGSCSVYQTIPFHLRNAIVSRIKIMADLDIAERRKPQDGKIKFKKFGGKDIELRVATIPTQGGLEDVVLRLLAANEPVPLEKMGFSESNYDNFVSAIIQPYGLVFLCGPTGSGKTTTLHSALKYINKPETKIWTAEDPVEITQKGLRQVQVKPKIGFDFAAAMRSFLRADPDVIMVGEMRDKETTSIGIEASLTGHLVFSTLHTNNAPESITRLLDMGMDPFNFADAILCILAQRLARTLCKDCKKEYHPLKEGYHELVREYGQEDFRKNIDIPYTDDLALFKPAGCENCNNSGYRGRMALHELLRGTDEIKRLIQNKARVDELRSQAIKDGMATLKQDGIEKIFKGHLDLLQVRKVCIK